MPDGGVLVVRKIWRMPYFAEIGVRYVEEQGFLQLHYRCTCFHLKEFKNESTVMLQAIFPPNYFLPVDVFHTFFLNIVDLRNLSRC